MLRAVVVDDERLARRELAVLLARDGRVEVVGEAASPPAAIAMIERLRPDVVFLDIRLGRATGFEVVGEIGDDIEIVFVTAHDEHAVRAFEVNALDYLLKPVEPQRLAATINRLRNSRPAAGDRLDTTRLTVNDWLFVRDGTRREFVAVRRLTHLTARGDCVTLHLEDGRGLTNGVPLAAWERRLPPGFIRIHRATIVNLEHVVRVEPWSQGTWQVSLRNTRTPLSLSRRHAIRAKALLGLEQHGG